jgi:segregation and condensation protein B
MNQADRTPAEIADLARNYARLTGPSWEDRAAAGARGGAALEALPPRRIVEAMLFVGGAPLTAERVGEAVRGLTPEIFDQLIDDLNRDYRVQGRPYRIRPRDHGWEIALHPRFRAVADRLHGSTREARLSPAALDVLALIAYRQPVGKPEIDALRGGESGGPLRQLIRLGLASVRREEAPRGEASYQTTPAFLRLFGLRSLDDLPRTQDLQRP